ncbi:MAG: M48 family metallopeptidase [Candidatus Glassbacteria bacterium]
MLRRAFYFFLVYPLIAALSGIDCSTLRNINIYSTAEEVQLGQSLDKEVHKQMEILADARVDSFLAVRGRKLTAVCKRRDIQYRFALVNDEAVNAFAIPGGFCYVNLGLFRNSDTEAELISVLAHEINHVTNRHSMKRLTQAQFAGIASDLLLRDAGTLTTTVANLFTAGGLLSFSRDAEREADHDGMLTMYDAGYDPQGMVDMFQRLKASREGPEPSRWENLFSTHPITDERIENAKKLIAQLPPKPGLVMNTPEWSEVIGYLRVKYPPPEKKK